MNSEILEKRLQELKDILHNEYVFHIDLAGWLSEFEKTMPNCKPEYIDIFEAFKSNLNSVKSVATLPFTMSFESAIRKILDSIAVRENILSGKFVVPDGETEPRLLTDDERKRIVHERVKLDFNSKINSEDGKREIWIETLSFLNLCANKSVGAPDFLHASKELLNQTILLMWSAFEVLARDFFVIYINTHPEAVTILFGKTDLGNRFNAKSIPLEILMKHNFDVTSKMGDILIEHFDFINIDITKTIFKALFHSERFNRAAKDKDIRKLYLMRNLIIHRRAIVDEKFKISTDESLEIGDKLQITPEQLKTILLKVIEFGTSLLGHVQQV